MPLGSERAHSQRQLFGTFNDNLISGGSCKAIVGAGNLEIISLISKSSIELIFLTTLQGTGCPSLVTACKLKGLGNSFIYRRWINWYTRHL